jgi:hypothetical protein
MSGNVSPYTEEGLLRMGGLRLVDKPFRVTDLAETLWQLVGGSGRWEA